MDNYRAKAGGLIPILKIGTDSTKAARLEQSTVRALAFQASGAYVEKFQTGQQFDRTPYLASTLSYWRGEFSSAHLSNSACRAVHCADMFVSCYKLKVWGPFDLRSPDGHSIRPTIRKSCALLAILALSKDHRQSRRWLQSQLWSESEDVQGAGSLRQELARLKRLMGDAIQSDKIDIWLDSDWFEFDHLSGKNPSVGAELLQGIDISDEAFEDWLREKRQYYANDTNEFDESASTQPQPWARKTTQQPILKGNERQTAGKQPRGNSKQCTVIFDCDAKGSLDANVAALFFSELLYHKLDQYEIFSCVGYENGERATSARASAPNQLMIVVRVLSVAQGGEVYLGVQLDSGILGGRLSFQSAVLAAGISHLHRSTSIGRLVENTMDTLLDAIDFDMLPAGSTSEALVLANEAKKLTFKLDKHSLKKADVLLARAYELDPLGQYLGWRGFLRNTAFFQHRNSDIFSEQLSSEELSLEALKQAPENAIVQAFSSQLDYVNQGNLTEPMIKAQRAVEIDRSDPLARALLSNSLTVNGFLSDGYAVAQQAIALAKGSRFEFYFHHFACMAATAARDYETALRHARSSVSYVPEFVSPRRYEVVLALQVGDAPGADRAVKAMRKTEPDFRVTSMLDSSYPVNTLRRLPIIDAIN